MTPSIHSHRWMVDLRSRFHDRRPRRFGNLACSLTRTSVRVRRVTHFRFCWDFLRGESAHKDGSLRKAVEDLRLDFVGGKSVSSAGAVESKISVCLVGRSCRIQNLGAEKFIKGMKPGSLMGLLEKYYNGMWSKKKH